MTPEPAEPWIPAPPTATYRLQLQPDFPFAAAEAAVPHLAGLGVSHLHLSPVLEAVPGSTHGYDVVDHARVRDELGGEEGLRALAGTARRHGLGLIADIVPNHMAAAPRWNRSWWEVLRDGPGSPYARWFDIDWDAHGGRVLLPVLAHRIGMEPGALRVDGDVLRYHEHTFPLRAGTEGLPVERLLDAQWYRLGWWRLARTELNYRRFFTVPELIGLRVEDPEVFHATHAKVLDLLREGVLEGLRVDHPDGLADPGGYLRRLHAATGGRWTVVEKILTDGEVLPASWPVAGTTGYDALRRVDGLFTDPAGAAELRRQYRDFTGLPADRGGRWPDTVRRAAYRVVTHELAAEVERLTRACHRLCAADPALRDHAPWALRTAIRELLVRLRVYRPYGPGDAAQVLTEEAARDARSVYTVPEEATAVDAVRGLLTGERGRGAEVDAFRARFAQTASAAHAKSVEDTAFYRYAPLLSATEVGGAPGAPASSADDFHRHCARVQRDWPLTGTVLSTHDTKRSADVRARIAVLTEVPERWAALLADLTERTARPGGVPAPDPLVAWAAWQSVVGIGFPGAGRLEGALLKHVREAGLRTSWTEPDADYERSVTDFVAAGPGGAPLERVTEFLAGLRPHVRANVLGAVLLQLTMPGVPDVYQGTEAEYLALVDPDNRRPVRFRPEDLPAPGAAVAGPDPSAEKAALTATALRLRRRLPGVFGEAASYTPLYASGSAAEHVVAHVRRGGGPEAALVAVTRLSARLLDAGGWGGTGLPLPDGVWRDLLTPGREFTGQVLTRDLFADLPVALLLRDSAEGGG
ncbi:malto-oligosyltrehalose synthase [Streptomyces uncialis]|uniref:Alpha-amylase n=1 Tax=Streptomyces uncialis TaxID=1048205 RepID=A0A1Q4V6T5_9ACTN|nr:malto-oligosyltrehalose synthase [Streptomyces uncialis]OKH93440.1 alpha-amylase [Streptomyces uncialis]